MKRKEYLLPICAALLGALLLLFGFLYKGKDTKKPGRAEEELACFLEIGAGVGNAEVRISYDENGAVCGAAVICEGGNDPSVRARVSELVSACLGIGMHRIYVTASA